VNLKPGKPLWFGVRNHADRRTLVFGLPGNPVSSLVCFELFVRPAIATLRGQPSEGLSRSSAPLANDFEHRGERPTYHPARLVNGAVQPLPWQGSGDLRTLAEATVLAHFPAGDRSYRAGETVEVLLSV
jgi:molybdopterin molybdotransferase